MDKRVAERIVNECEEYWNKQHEGEVFSIDKEFLEGLKRVLILSPHKDGNQRVVSITRNKVYLVPFKDIILFGLKHSDLDKYPEAKE